MVLRTSRASGLAGLYKGVRNRTYPRVERGQAIAIGAVAVKGERIFFQFLMVFIGNPRRNMRHYQLFLVKILLLKKNTVEMQKVWNLVIRIGSLNREIN